MSRPDVVDSILLLTILADAAAPQWMPDVVLDWGGAAAAVQSWDDACGSCGSLHGWRLVRPFGLELLRQIREGSPAVQRAFLAYYSMRKGRPVASVHFSCRFGERTRVAFVLAPAVESGGSP